MNETRRLNTAMQTSLIDQIGDTPLVEIKRLNPHAGVRLFAKL